MHRQIAGALSALMLLQLSVAVASADPISPSRRSVITPCLTLPCFPISDDEDPLSLADTLTAPDGSTLSYEAFAMSTFGALGTSVSATLDRETAGNGWVLASAQLTDWLTISHPAFSGNGLFEFWYTLDGTLSHSGVVNAEAEIQALVDIDGFGSGAQAQVTRTTHTRSAFDRYSAGVFSFIWNKPYNIGFHLNTAVGNVEFGGTPIRSLGPVTGFGRGSADFANTATIAGFTFYDASMRPVRDVTLVSGSGTKYRVRDVPEPTTVLSLIVGGTLAISRARRRINRPIV